jgi:hypothetical protein
VPGAKNAISAIFPKPLSASFSERNPEIAIPGGW